VNAAQVPSTILRELLTRPETRSQRSRPLDLTSDPTSSITSIDIPLLLRPRWRLGRHSVTARRPQAGDSSSRLGQIDIWHHPANHSSTECVRSTRSVSAGPRTTARSPAHYPFPSPQAPLSPPPEEKSFPSFHQLEWDGSPKRFPFRRWRRTLVVFALHRGFDSKQPLRRLTTVPPLPNRQSSLDDDRSSTSPFIDHPRALRPYPRQDSTRLDKTRQLWRDCWTTEKGERARLRSEI
jgi:hypothetical protein